ncbi:hypothetical protein C8R44DRAFT_768375 [Mycena epipterygia]|nr:hypothetical protein C8R44DRAFT_768375 [Mycena epipterygia]
MSRDTPEWQHLARMAAAQTVFSICPAPLLVDPPPNSMSVPVVDPNEDILDRFWRRVAELTSRYHDTQKKWIGGKEIRQWNKLNRKACKNCLRSKIGRVCVIDEDQPSCRACRATKIGCDRKPQFVFDLTKDDFFPTYDQFIRVYKNREPGRLRRYIRMSRRIPRDGGSYQIAPSSISAEHHRQTVHGQRIFWRTGNDDAQRDRAKCDLERLRTPPGDASRTTA